MDNAKRISEKFQEIKKSKHEFQKFQSCTLKFKNQNKKNQKKVQAAKSLKNV